MLASSDKTAADIAQWAVIDVEGVAAVGGDRAGERTGQDDLPGFERDAVRRQTIDAAFGMLLRAASPV